MGATEPKPIRLELTQEQAERLGIVFCKCGHRPNNHFDFGKRECARCACKSYRQTVRLP